MSDDEEMPPAENVGDMPGMPGMGDMPDDMSDMDGGSDSYPPPEAVGTEVDLSPDKDGKLIKTISALGAGYEKPPTGSEVTVHYTGTLEDGTVFDSSRERDKPFVFHIGQGQVIKGWDVGVASMKKGERAVLKCAPEYAYGEEGSPPKIPASATLQFDVELIHFTSWKDVSKAKDEAIMKKVLKDGEGWEKPEFDTKVTLSWKLTVEGSEDVLEEKTGLVADVGSEVLPSGLETAVEQMKKGEQALVKVKPSVRGPTESCPTPQGVADDAVLVYDVTLAESERPPSSWNLKGAAEKFEWANKRKDEGNALFKLGKLARAQKKYKAAADYVSSDYDMADEEKAQAKALKVSINNNLAAVAIKESDWSEVVKLCEKVLELAPGNSKALLRRGKAHNELNDWDFAKRDLQKVLDMDGAPEAADAKKEMARVAKKIKTQNQKDKALFGDMFKKINLERKESPAAAKPKPEFSDSEDDEGKEGGEAEAPAKDESGEGPADGGEPATTDSAEPAAA